MCVGGERERERKRERESTAHVAKRGKTLGNTACEHQTGTCGPLRVVVESRTRTEVLLLEKEHANERNP